MGREGKPLDKVHEALKRGQYRDAINMTSLALQSELEPEQLSYLMDALLAAAAGLSDNSAEELQAYSFVVEIGDALPDEDVYRVAVQLKVNSALFNKGVVLAQLGRMEEATAIYDELLSRTGTARHLGLRESAVRGLFNKGASLGGRQRFEEAITVYDELVGRFSADPEPTFSEAVGKALINKGIALAELDRLSEAIAVLDDVVSRWGDSRDPILRERASKALLNKASALLQLSDRAEALATYEEIVSRFGDDADPMLMEQVEMARYRKENLESRLN
jgi:tetratricopeptide (TPR) repeat protein